MLSRMPEPMSAEVDNLLQTLRAEGAGRITALAAIRSRTGCGVVEAQAILAAHPAWRAPRAVQHEDPPPEQWDTAELLLYAMEYLDMYILFRFGDEPIPDLAIGYLETTLECVEDARASLAARAAGSGLG